MSRNNPFAKARQGGFGLVVHWFCVHGNIRADQAIKGEFMLRVFAFFIAALCAAGAAADMITAFDESGDAVKLDTAALSGCRMIFDRAGAPFEICRMKKLELAPPSSTRMRPGHAQNAGEEKSQVVYVRAAE